MLNVLIAHGTSHDPATTTLYAGYSWDEWAGLVITIIGFLVVITLIVRRGRQDRAK